MKKSGLGVLLYPLNNFIKQESTAGILLFAAAVVAIVWANSPFSESYHHLWETNFSVSFAGEELSKPLHHWINDGLMSVFFFVVGLELKREFMAGELASLRKATLPIAAAIGGMMVPALIYLLFNWSTDGRHGWGIPMATDIAFALGVLSLLKTRIPAALKVFLTALAIVDDLGAVLVIAFFYTTNISLANLGWGALFMGVLILSNAMGVRNTIYYAIIGIGGLWLAFMLSGVHATIAGVLAAFTIPANTKIDEIQYSRKMKRLLENFDREIPNNYTLVTEKQNKIIENIRKVSLDAQTPLQKLEHALHPLVSFLIMPVFALANAGVALRGNIFSTMAHPVTIGIIAGLVIGKFVGIVIFSRLTVWTGLASLPDKSSWTHLYGAALLGGIGFTMSLFISQLAFKDPVLDQYAKIGILSASVIAGTMGFLVLRFFTAKPAATLND
jgi:Na+:H+ antiporter, NhaA family